MEQPESLGIKSIAKLAGVSIGTVDRVLNNRKGVSDDTKAKILDIVEKTGFQKNIIASRLKLAGVKKIEVAILIPEITNDWSYWKLPLQGIEKAVNELKEQGISVQYFYFNIISPISYWNTCLKIFNQNFHGIVTVPFFEAESIQLLEKAEKEHTLIVFLDTFRPLNHSSSFICQNSFNAGMVAGRLLHGLVSEEGLYFVVNIVNTQGVFMNNQQRESGFRAFFEENFKGKNISIHTINHFLENEKKITLEVQALFKSEKPKGIFVANSRAFLLIDMLKEFDIKNTFIVGFDLNQKNLQYLESGDIHFLLNQKPELQGYAAIKGLYKFFTKDDPSDLSIDIPVEIIVKENATL